MSKRFLSTMITKVHVNKGPLARFRKKAKLLFPAELLGICVGTVESGIAVVKDILIPDDQENTEDFVNVPVNSYEIARQYAYENGWVVLGDIHTHCSEYFAVEETTPSKGDTIISEEVLTSLSGYGGFLGIMSLEKTKKNRFRSKMNFWPIYTFIPHRVI